jgi:KaiC/GvpD/RAD55 family RecA-like ATPase
VIVLYNVKRGSKRVRGLEILKMRGTKHSENICMFEITKNGIVVYPDEVLFVD